MLSTDASKVSWAVLAGIRKQNKTQLNRGSAVGHRMSLYAGVNVALEYRLCPVSHPQPRRLCLRSMSLGSSPALTDTNGINSSLPSTRMSGYSKHSRRSWTMHSAISSGETPRTTSATSQSSSFREAQESVFSVGRSQLGNQLL